MNLSSNVIPTSDCHHAETAYYLHSSKINISAVGILLWITVVPYLSHSN